MANFKTTFTVDQNPQVVCDAIRNIRGWWSGKFIGDSDSLGAEFEYRYGDVHFSKQKVTEFIPGKRIVWHVTDASLNFVDDKKEWIGTDVIFDIAEKNGKTELTFTHAGLIPVFQCYDACSNAWTTL